MGSVSGSRLMTKPVHASFQEFYGFYLSQHRHPVCKGLHVAGVVLVAVLGAGLLAGDHVLWLPFLPLAGYACSWTGHFVFEGNKPATFGYPWWSLLGDLRMTWEVLAGRAAP